VKNLPKDFKSTRIGSSGESANKKKVQSAGKSSKKEVLTTKQIPSSTEKQPSSSVKKTPSVKTTPRYLGICDLDTPRKATPNVSSSNKILVRKEKQAASAGNASKTTPKMLNEVQRMIIKRLQSKLIKSGD
jgi:hypothetical protein